MFHTFARRVFAAVVISSLLPGPGRPLFAQNPPPVIPAPPNPLTAAVRTAVVDSVAAQLSRFYAVADTGALIAAHLTKRHRSGAYDALTNPQLFAEALSTDMKAINGDRHLSVSLRGPGPAMPMGLATLPPMNFSPPPQAPPQVLAAAKRNNFELGKVEVLPGNIGYFEMKGFNGLRDAREPVVAALRFLENTDAIILDVRMHPGGSADLSNFIISHFTGPDSVASLDVAIRAANQQYRRWTMSSVPGPRRPDVPVYVLTSRGTVSAGEDFAFVLRNLGRATLVGESTAGAGRNNPTFDAGHGFAASISVSTVKDPKTGAEWEGMGVKPHIAVPPRTALAVAHSHALKLLADRAADPMRKRELELAREVVEAEAKPHAVSATTMQGYVGTFGGERTITIENGRLVYRRTPYAIGFNLVPLSDTLFALGNVARVSFAKNAAGQTTLSTVLPGSPPLVFPRSGPAPQIASEY